LLILASVTHMKWARPLKLLAVALAMLLLK
jgi:hypothetical protein